MSAPRFIQTAMRERGRARPCETPDQGAAGFAARTRMCDRHRSRAALGPGLPASRLRLDRDNPSRLRSQNGEGQKRQPTAARVRVMKGSPSSGRQSRALAMAMTGNKPRAGRPASGKSTAQGAVGKAAKNCKMKSPQHQGARNAPGRRQMHCGNPASTVDANTVNGGRALGARGGGTAGRGDVAAARSALAARPAVGDALGPQGRAAPTGGTGSGPGAGAPRHRQPAWAVKTACARR